GSAPAKSSTKGRGEGRARVIRQAGAQDEDRTASGPARPERPVPVVTMVPVNETKAVTVSKIIYKAFGPRAELIDDGPGGLQGFLVREDRSRQGAGSSGGDSGVQFAVGIDEKRNKLAVEAPPVETQAVVKLVQAIDAASANPQTAVRAVAVTKN